MSEAMTSPLQSLRNVCGDPVEVAPLEGVPSDVQLHLHVDGSTEILATRGLVDSAVGRSDGSRRRYELFVRFPVVEASAPREPWRSMLLEAVRLDLSGIVAMRMFPVVWPLSGTMPAVLLFSPPDVAEDLDPDDDDAPYLLQLAPLTDDEMRFALEVGIEPEERDRRADLLYEALEDAGHLRLANVPAGETGRIRLPPVLE